MQDVQGEFEDLLLPDARLVDRVQSFVAAAWKSPAASFPKMLEGVASLEGAYRLLNNPRVSYGALHAGHRAKTEERAREAGDVVVVHDTSDIKTPYADAEEVGYLQT